MTECMRRWKWLSLLALAALIAACNGNNGDDNGGTTATATPTVQSANPTDTPTTSVPPTATPTTSSAASVSGLVVLQRDVRATSGDALGAPPAEAVEAADEIAFDRAFSHADWVLSGPVARSGSTGDDGSFDIAGLPPGRYTLKLTKVLNGNLVDAIVPLVVGDDGRAQILVEIGQGLVRSSSTYPDGDATVREVSGPDGSRAVTRDGQVVEIGDQARTIVDRDGDGLFDPAVCYDGAWLCDEAGSCGPDRVCQCSASCPFCDDCGPNVCVPPGDFAPYRCREGGGCELPGDRCTCIPSCPDCTDCALNLCIPSCDSFEIADLRVEGPSQIVLGRTGSMRAYAVLGGGGQIDVTFLATWKSSNESVATVDSWGTVSTHDLGSTDVTATLGDLTSDPWPLEVVERPGLERIVVPNISCFYPLGLPRPGEPFPDPATAPVPRDILPPCTQVVRIGGTIQFAAIGEFADGSFEDLTDEVEWEVDPAGVGDVDKGLFTGRQEGTATVRASLGDVVSDPSSEIRVVTEATIVYLSIFPLRGPLPAVLFPEGPLADAAFPCFDCGYGLTVLQGDEIPFQATAQYDTGEWEDVTAKVTWRSTDSEVASIDSQGLMTALAAGDTSIDAVLDDVTSAAVDIHVVDEATLLDLSIYQDGQDRVVAKGEQAFFNASANYDVGFYRDVTEQATWRSSDESVGGFDEPGVFTGRSAGTVEVWAELDGKESNHLPFEVFETSALDYCDPEHVNRGEWFDAFNRVILESDCAGYTPPDVATFRFTVTERERPRGIFDPCLDLFVYDGDQKIRTIRDEGCGEPFLAPGAPEFDAAAPRYQLLAFWDLKDDRGNVVPPGQYKIFGRFYLYFDPVVSIDVAVTAPNGRIPCIDNPCGNGCEYVHVCGDLNPPTQCPAVCKPLCECPQGWGITADNDCEPCVDECCPADTTCSPSIPPCEPVKDCCNADETCVPELPPCEPVCCPPNARCVEGVPPCPSDCCTAESCPDGLPSCSPEG